MTSGRRQGRAGFFWQGLFILLPVAIMAGIALTALVRDRAAAEREARQRAEELLQQVSNGFDRAMGFQLSRFALGAYADYGQRWSQQHLAEAAMWPGSPERRRLESERQTLAEAYTETEAAFAELARVSGLRPEEFIITELSFTPEGMVNTPNEEAREAHPPAWRLELAAKQLETLNGLEELDGAGTNAEAINAAFKGFLDTDPPAGARANAEFLRLRLVLKDEPASNAVAQWLEFVQSCWGPSSLQGEAGPLSEPGVPLSSLALAKALQRARETGPSEALWNGLVGEVQRAPGSFTPMLLDLAEPLVQTRPELQSCLHALKLRWEATQRAWEAADAIRCSGRLQGITTTNFWLEFQGSRWLCLLQPAQSWTGSGPGTITNYFTQARLCPKAAVEQALRQALQSSRVSLPPYLRFAAVVEGEPLAMVAQPMPLLTELEPGKGSTVTYKDGAADGAGVVLAQTEGRLSCPATQENRMEPGSQSVTFESMPGRPHFVLRIELANRALLFAAQRRRTWMYGALVLAAALTASVGFGAAYRSFHRQLHLNEMKSNFVSSVSHELRAPIASVRLMAESLERGKIVEPPKQQEYFRFIGQECRRLSSLIENVLDFSRIEQGRKQYEFEPTDLVELTGRTAQLMETYAAERGVRLALALPIPQPSTLNPQPSLDGKAIQQALINLIDNALKHSASGETVTVGLEMRNANGPHSQAPNYSMSDRSDRSDPSGGHVPGMVALWVEDHGPGIPASEHERIFERFYRLGSELRRDTQGVGIGLSIVRHVVEAHGGRVRVRSAPGQGSRFTIELPLAAQGLAAKDHIEPNR